MHGIKETRHSDRLSHFLAVGRVGLAGIAQGSSSVMVIVIVVEKARASWLRQPSRHESIAFHLRATMRRSQAMYTTLLQKCFQDNVPGLSYKVQESSAYIIMILLLPGSYRGSLGPPLRVAQSG
jgi:hypothetical protein